jgi:ABC-type cobalamin/Fe3+-siderophores transport system ATPase subunit
MSKKLTIEHLDYSTNDKPLLQDISVEFFPGCMHAILGPNGSGKSTLLMALAGIRKLSAGSVFWGDQSLFSLKRQEISRIISLVPQHPQPSFDFLVEDIVAMGRYAHTMQYWQAKDTPLVQHALTCVDAWHLRHRKVTQLSYGERQRVYIARALVTESPILLLDEPTASLDIRHQLEIWELLQILVANGKIVIITTHDFTIAERYCRQVVVLNHGRCVGKGPFSSLMTPQLIQEVFGISETTLNSFRLQSFNKS